MCKALTKCATVAQLKKNPDIYNIDIDMYTL